MYFFNQPKYLDFVFSQKAKVSDVIKHIITIYNKSSELGSNPFPLPYSSEPEAYELRLIDDDEEEWTPFMEIAPRKREEPIG